MQNISWRKNLSRLAAFALLLLIALLPYAPAAGSPTQQLANCKEYAFSTSEDFITQGPIPSDGNPIISEGDLLGPGCSICARNSDLLEGFNVSVDLGLDAVDILDIQNYLVAFSTELNSPNTGQFSAGDLLVTNGAIIPNQALTFAFGNGEIDYDLGLDGLHFVGEIDKIIAFLDEASTHDRTDWLTTPDLLKSLLTQFAIDIWYSTEEGWTVVGAPGFLDGDLLSAVNGTTIVAKNSTLLDLTVPAGLPDRGVDFGLDAITNDRTNSTESILFSTEILYESDEFSFTDGDVLQIGDGIAYKNSTLVGCFEPHAQMLGLDAFYKLYTNKVYIYLPLVFNSVQGQ